ncbi:MAG: hypothetical protein JNL38_38405 [Myxococcales bacterium]|nr:hypothetical protein [Myxococcales bacterium]
MNVKKPVIAVIVVAASTFALLGASPALGGRTLESGHDGGHVADFASGHDGGHRASGHDGGHVADFASGHDGGHANAASGHDGGHRASGHDGGH